MEKSKIGNFEAVAVILTIIINHSFLNLPKAIIDNQKSSTLLNLLYVSTIAILITIAVIKLFKNFPGFDIIDISDYLGGKVLKIILGILYFLFYLLAASTLLRSFCDNLKILYYPVSRIIFILFLFILALMINGNFNFNSLIRANMFIIPFVIMSILFLFFTNVKNFSFDRIFPILGYGIQPTFINGISNLFAFGGLTFIYFIPQNLKNPENFKNIALTAIILSALYLILSTSTIFFMFSSFAGIDEEMPLFNAVRYIEFGTFFQRLDAIFLLIWIMSLISYLTISTRLALNVFKKITNIKSEKSLVSPIGLLVLAISLCLYSSPIVHFFENYLYKYLFFVLVIFISLSILIFANLKKLKHKEAKN